MTNREQYRLAAIVVAATLGAVIAVRLARPERWGRVLWRQPEASESSTLPEVAPPGDAYFPGVNVSALERVRDDWPFRDDDREAYFNLFGVLAKSDPAALAKAAVPVTFAQLRKQSAAYRGRVVTVSGRVRGVFEQSFPKNDQGYQKYHQLWLQLDDAPDWPVTAHCMNLPKGFPSGTKIDAPVKITGFFFKRIAYVAGDGARTAPTLLARTVSWQPPPASEPAPQVSARSLVILGVGSVAILVWMIVWYRRRRREPPQWMPAPPPDFEGIQARDSTREESS